MLVCPTRAQEIRNVTFGWGDAMRLGRWTPVFITVEDAQVREVDLQIHGSYGEKSAALWLHQTAVAQPLPVTYGLLFPVNAQLSRIEVIVSDRHTGRTLGAQTLQNNSAFSPAGQVPIRLLATDDTLIGISGNVDDALRLKGQFDRAEIPGGVLDPIRLPANFAGYDGISALVLAAPDLGELKDDQEQAILEWIGRGGNLLLIPPTTSIPTRDDLVDALPCAIGVNRTVIVPADSPATRPSALNGRELSPRAGSESFGVLDQTGYRRRLGLGQIAVVPVDLSQLEFADAQSANAFWKSMLEPMVKVPPIGQPSENVVSEEDQYLVPGPNAADSSGRGARESVSIRHVLELLGAAAPTGGTRWRSALLSMALIFFLLGPVDSVVLMRLGQPPRNSLTIIGWIGLILSVGVYAIARPIRPASTVSTFRLVDQIKDSLVGATDVLALSSESPKLVPLTLDKDEWWEPANQAARSFSVDRFLDANCREDRNGCRPELVRLNGSEPQAWHGEAAGLGAACLTGSLSLGKDRSGVWHLGGKLTNASPTAMTDIFVETNSGNFQIAESLGAGATMDLGESAISDAASLDGLPKDFADVAPERTDRIDEMVRKGSACVICEMPDAQDVKAGEPVDEHWQALRAVMVIGR